MELETAVPRSTHNAYLPATAVTSTVEAETTQGPLEYGCVDWYSYTSAWEKPGDWDIRAGGPTAAIGP
jgi:hypothetical protein